jgi:Bacterial Ig-like domain
MIKTLSFLFLLVSNIFGLFLVRCEAQGLNPTSCTPGEILFSSRKIEARTSAWMNGYWYVPCDLLSVLDIKNPRAPKILLERTHTGSNGHNYFFVNGRYYWRDYSVPEAGSERFLDVLRFPTLSPVRFEPFNRLSNLGDMSVWTYPHSIEGNLSALADRGGKRPENFFVVGNILVLSYGDGDDGSIARFDIYDPKRPRLVASRRVNAPNYTTTKKLFRNHLIMTDQGTLTAFDFDNDLTESFKLSGWPGRYSSFQDEFGLANFAQSFVKFNMVTRQRVGVWPSGNGNDFSWLPVGNLALGSGDPSDNSASATIFCHQATPDSRAPFVAYTNPKNGQTNVPLTSRVGLVIHETLEPSTVTPSNILLRPVGGSAVRTVVLYGDHDVIQLLPQEPLLANTTYEVILVAGGIKDAAGNAIGHTDLRFSTGPSLDGRPLPSTTAPTPAVISPLPTQPPPPTIFVTIAPSQPSTVIEIVPTARPVIDRERLKALLRILLSRLRAKKNLTRVTQDIIEVTHFTSVPRQKRLISKALRVMTRGNPDQRKKALLLLLRFTRREPLEVGK